MPTVEEIRLYAHIERTMKKTGILDRLVKGSAHFDDYEETLTIFLKSLAQQLIKSEQQQRQYSEEEVIAFAEWTELEGYRIKGYDQTMRKTIFQQWNTNHK